jgi:hypothetical protein
MAMRQRITKTRFGSITVGGTVFRYDVIVRPDGRVKRRKKKLSKNVYGTSHMISRQEAKYVRKQARHADRLIVGTGQYGNVELSPEAAAYLKRKMCRVVLAPTPKAIGIWGKGGGQAIGLFHVTC